MRPPFNRACWRVRACSCVCCGNKWTRALCTFFYHQRWSIRPNRCKSCDLSLSVASILWLSTSSLELSFSCSPRWTLRIYQRFFGKNNANARRTNKKKSAPCLELIVADDNVQRIDCEKTKKKMERCAHKFVLSTSKAPLIRHVWLHYRSMVAAV